MSGQAFDPSMLRPRPVFDMTDDERAQAQAALIQGGGWQGKVMMLHALGTTMVGQLEKLGYQVQVQTRMTGWTLSVDLPMPDGRDDVKAIGT